MQLLRTLASVVTLSSFIPSVTAQSRTECDVTLLPRPKLYCGSRGTLDSPDVRRTITPSTFADCRDTCVYRSAKRCISFQYTQEGDGTCVLFGKTLRNQGYKRGTSPNGEVHYNRNCFKVSNCRCPLSPGEAPPFTPDEVLTDGSFEQGLSSWNATGQASFSTQCTEENYPYYGTTFVSFVDSSNNNDTAAVSQQRVFYELGQVYRLSYYYRIPRAASDSECRIDFKMNGQLVSGYVPPNVDQWTQYQSNVVAFTQSPVADGNLVELSAFCESPTPVEVQVDSASLVRQANSSP